MKVTHYNEASEQITKIDLEKDEVLHIHHSIFDKQINYRMGQSTRAIDKQYQKITVLVEDNLFIVEATSNGKTSKKLFSDIFGFYIEKLD